MTFMDIRDVRRLNLIEIAKKFSSQGKCADYLGIKRPQMSRWITNNKEARQGINEESARAIEEKLGLGRGALDLDAIDSTSHRVSEPEVIYLAPPPAEEKEQVTPSTASDNHVILAIMERLKVADGDQLIEALNAINNILKRQPEPIAYIGEERRSASQ